MKTARKVLAILAIIFSAIEVVSLVVVSILCFVLTGYTAEIMKQISASYPEMELTEEIVKFTLIALGVVMLVVLVFGILTLVFSIKLLKNPSLKAGILCIVFGLLCQNYLVLIAGIFGVIADSTEPKESKPIE